MKTQGFSAMLLLREQSRLDGGEAFRRAGWCEGYGLVKSLSSPADGGEVVFGHVSLAMNPTCDSA